MVGKFPMNGCLDKAAISQAEDLLGGGRSIQSQDSHNLVPVGTLMDIGITIQEPGAAGVHVGSRTVGVKSITTEIPCEVASTGLEITKAWLLVVLWWSA